MGRLLDERESEDGSETVAEDQSANDEKSEEEVGIPTRETIRLATNSSCCS